MREQISKQLEIAFLGLLFAVTSCTSRIDMKASSSEIAIQPSNTVYPPTCTQPLIPSPTSYPVTSTATPPPWTIISLPVNLPDSRLFYEAPDSIYMVDINCAVHTQSCFSDPISISPGVDDTGGMRVSPDGNLVAIARVDDYGNPGGLEASIQLISSEENRIWAVAPMGTHHPVWSPDGGKIAYIDYLVSGGKYSRICFSTVIEQFRCLSHAEGPVYYSDLIWSPYGKYLAYCETSFETDNCELYVLELDSYLQVQISPNAENPLWFPNGNLYFVELAENESKPIIADVVACIDKAENCKQPLEYLVPGTRFAFSPDGNHLSYVDEGGRLGVVESNCVIDPPMCTDSPNFLTNPEYRVMDYSWSPDSNYIAYSASIDTKVEIYIVDISFSGTYLVETINSNYYLLIDWRPP